VAAALQEVGAGSIGGVLVGYGERSRASHHVTRMERRGLVKRQECSDDGRGAWVVLTDAGRAAIERAAPGHVETVRRLVFEVLTRDEIDVLDKVVDKVLARLEEGSIQPTA
jgi:DNA-binding MarR family transcriptional regulator